MCSYASSASRVSDEVPGASHYSRDYLSTDAIRLTSYRMQVAYALGIDPANALIVGKGDGIVGAILKTVGVDVTTLDIQADLAPDICASVLQMPIPSDSFDVSLCCQVLEHLPFAELSLAVAELKRVTRKRIVISLPDERRYLGLRLAYRRRSWAFAFSIPMLRKRALPQFRRESAGHQWEIGYVGSTYRDVVSAFFQGGVRDIRGVRNPDWPWHTFFVADIGKE